MLVPPKMTMKFTHQDGSKTKNYIILFKASEFGDNTFVPVCKNNYALSCVH